MDINISHINITCCAKLNTQDEIDRASIGFCWKKNKWMSSCDEIRVRLRTITAICHTQLAWNRTVIS